MTTRSLHILVLFLLTILSLETANALQVDEFELKTAYLYNFALFTTWPASWENRDTITICTLGDDRFGTAIEQLHNRSARTKRLVVRRAIALEQAPSCHMLYIAESERQNMVTILESLRGSSVLTICDAPSGPALDEGGAETSESATSGTGPSRRCAITLVLDNKRLMFEVDSAVTKQAGLTMSSKLLYLARHVY